jgi:hypothetical protein
MSIHSNPKPHCRLGLDFGDTIVTANNQAGKALKMSEDPKYLNRQEMPDAITSIARLVSIFTPQDVFIVSRCSLIGEQKIMAWLYYHNFWEQTGVLRENIRFCRERHEKGPICQKLGITHFVDDRLEVLAAMNTVRHRYRLSSVAPDADIPCVGSYYGGTIYKSETGNTEPIFNFKTWPKILGDILETFGEE